MGKSVDFQRALTFLFGKCADERILWKNVFSRTVEADFVSPKGGKIRPSAKYFKNLFLIFCVNFAADIDYFSICDKLK